MNELIINADDFGLCECVNIGIIDAYKNGALTSATLMMNTAAVMGAVELIKKNHMPVGIHLNLNYGNPLSKLQDCRTLVNIQTGQFYKDAYLLINGIQHKKIKLEEIENEYHNQLALAADYGLKLTHIDSHKHLHHFLPIYKIIEKLAKKFNIKKIRIAAEYGFYQYFNDILEFGDNDYLYQMYIQSCLKNGCYKSDWFDEPYNFFGFFYAGKMTIDKYYKLFEAIKQADKPIEIMCHPAYNCRELAQISSLTYHRENELNTLKSAELKELLRDYKLIDFSGLLKK